MLDVSVCMTPAIRCQQSMFFIKQIHFQGHSLGDLTITFYKEMQGTILLVDVNDIIIRVIDLEVSDLNMIDFVLERILYQHRLEIIIPKVCVNSAVNVTHILYTPFVQQNTSFAQSLHTSHIMADKQHGSSLPLTDILPMAFF